MYSYINALIGCAVLLSFALLLLLLELLDALLQHIGPKVTLKVRQLLGTGQTVFSRLLEDVLWGWTKKNCCLSIVYSAVYFILYLLQDGAHKKCLIIVELFL